MKNNYISENLFAKFVSKNNFTINNKYKSISGEIEGIELGQLDNLYKNYKVESYKDSNK